MQDGWGKIPAGSPGSRESAGAKRGGNTREPTFHRQTQAGTSARTPPPTLTVWECSDVAGPSPEELFGYLNPLFLSCHPQLIQCPRFNLPHSLFGHAHFVADFLERLRFLTVVQPEAANDNSLLAFVKP
jgi:hypothetical protein